MKIALDRTFTKQARGRFERYEFQVGILQDRTHYVAAPKEAGLKSFAGGPARKATRVSAGNTVADISEKMRARLKVNFYTHPFKSRKNRDILKFSKAFFDLVRGRGQRRRVENYLQAIVRNPILRGDYGRNSRIAAKNKGFNRLMIDTGQLFKAIKATTRMRRVSK